MDGQKQETFLKDYQPPVYLVDTVDLQVNLVPQATRVSSRLQCRRNPACSGSATKPLHLDARRLQLLRLALDGVELREDQYAFSDTGLEIFTPPQNEFVLEIETLINPEANTELEGLYRSAGNYCTQCEAEGFRTITCFPDRPDVMAVFTTTIIADKNECPVLLANGNLRDSGDLPDGRHYAVWHDPFPKPCYLFALVAGRLVSLDDFFVTCSGKKVDLRIYVEPRNQNKCGHAMQSLKKAMRWDEERFGREYDLDIYMIVAVDDFNMGAMENKGLNVFNSKYVLALPETATDSDYEGIEAVIAHEYFHNWTGNRITCRDWFQLSLKEGLTVFRDQEFSADMLSRPVKRIRDVNIIRSFQFREDSGPMAHPVRPPSFVEINNFYTLTVYNKGAEVIRMLHTLLGPANFRRGMDIYFTRHDGQAVTCDDFVAAMEAAWGKSLAQFTLWYSQAGTPDLQVRPEYDAKNRRLHVHLRQTCPPTRESAEKKPFLIPVVMGLLDQCGRSIALPDADKSGVSRTLVLEQQEQDFVFENVTEQPVLSVLRDFSAPVRLDFQQSDAELALLMAHDPDPFNRWDAGQRLLLRALLQQIEVHQRGGEIVLDPQIVEGMRSLLADQKSDPAFLALSLCLPTENWIAQQMSIVDPIAIFDVRQRFYVLLAQALRKELQQRYKELRASGPYQYNKEDAARRSLRNTCLACLLAVDRGNPPTSAALALGREQYYQSDNMTDKTAALHCLVNSDLALGQELLDDLYKTWQDDPLVMDKWLILQAGCTLPGTLERIRALTRHPVFSYRNPNKVRSLVATFCATNHSQFHAEDGQGYDFLAEQVILLDELNPQIAARMINPLTQWRRYDSIRQEQMRQALRRIGEQQHKNTDKKLSDDVREVISRSLK